MIVYHCLGQLILTIAHNCTTHVTYLFSILNGLYDLLGQYEEAQVLSPVKLGAAIGRALKQYYQNDMIKQLKVGRNAEDNVVEKEFNEYKYLQRQIILEYIRSAKLDVNKSAFRNTWNSTITSKVRNFKLRSVYHMQSDETNNEANWKFLIAPEFAAFLDALCHTMDMLQRCYSLIVMYYNFLHGENSKQHNVSHTHIWNGENLLAVLDWC